MPGKQEPSWEERFERKMKRIEARMEEIGKRVEERGEALGRRMEEAAEQEGPGHRLFWGIVLFVVGIVWLGNNLNWFARDVPWPAVAMIAGGLYLILRTRNGKVRPEEGSPQDEH